MKTALELVMQAIITAQWSNNSNGDVEAPTGHFAIVERPSHPGELNDMLAAIEDMDDPDNIDMIHAFEDAEPGFYAVVEDSNGLVHITGPHTQQEATEWFTKAEDAYAEWNAQDENDV